MDASLDRRGARVEGNAGADALVAASEEKGYEARTKGSTALMDVGTDRGEESLRIASVVREDARSRLRLVNDHSEWRQRMLEWVRVMPVPLYAGWRFYARGWPESNMPHPA